MSNLVPMVISRENNSERAMDIYSKLLDERIIFLTGTVDEQMAEIIIAQLLFLENTDPTKDITIQISSSGGSVYHGLSIVNTMDYIKCDIVTVVCSHAMSMGSFISSSGTPGKRFVLEDSTILIHQVLGGTSGQLSDMELDLLETQRLKTLLNKRLAKNTKKSVAKIEKDTNRNNYMSSQDAINYNLADKILLKR